MSILFLHFLSFLLICSFDGYYSEMSHKKDLFTGIEGRSNRFQIKLISYTKGFKIEFPKII